MHTNTTKSSHIRVGSPGALDFDTESLSGPSPAKPRQSSPRRKPQAARQADVREDLLAKTDPTLATTIGKSVAIFMHRAVLGALLLFATLAGLVISTPADATERSRSFGVYDCAYNSRLDDGYWSTLPSVWTTGDDDCKFVDADLKYNTHSGYDAQVYTQYCATRQSWFTECKKDGVYMHRGRSRAMDWEKESWGSSGWWGM
jgi:hypothetical protein